MQLKNIIICKSAIKNNGDSWCCRIIVLYHSCNLFKFVTSMKKGTLPFHTMSMIKLLFENIF